MQCPYCNYKESKVVDSRHTDSNSIRRRRECESCKKRYTTYETIETTPVMVVKKDNTREYFDREKIATTEIGHMVALPHGANGKILKNKIAVGILKNPIHWTLDDVRLVLILAIDKDEIFDYEKLFSTIYKQVGSVSKVIGICENKSYEKFMKMF